MKQFVMAVVLVAGLGIHAFAQNLPDYDSIKLNNSADCLAAEPSALAAANYLFSTPFSDESIPRLKSLKFIIGWMSATPDHKFTLDNVTEKVTKGNENLLGLYMAAMTKYVLDNKGTSPDDNTIKLYSVGMLLDYCGSPSNNIKMTKQLKSLAEARSKGELAKALE